MRWWQYFDIHLCGCNQRWINISSVIVSFNALSTEGRPLLQHQSFIKASGLPPEISICWILSRQRCPWWQKKAKSQLWITSVWTGIWVVHQPGSNLSRWVTMTTSSLSFPLSLSFLLWWPSSSVAALLPKDRGEAKSEAAIKRPCLVYLFSAEITAGVLQISPVLRADSPDSNSYDACKISPSTPFLPRPSLKQDQSCRDYMSTCFA